MSLKAKVKVSEVTNLSDARYCAGMGVEMIGFHLDENHPRFIELSTAKEISTWICGIKVVGEFSGTNIENINYLSKELGLDYVQLPHPVDTEEAKKLHKPLIIKLLYVPGQEEKFEEKLNRYKNLASLYLVESNETDNINGYEEYIKRWATEYPLILGFGINVESLDKITEEIKPWGIGLKGGDEIKPGLKNFDELADILEELEDDDF